MNDGTTKNLVSQFTSALNDRLSSTMPPDPHSSNPTPPSASTDRSNSSFDSLLSQLISDPTVENLFDALEEESVPLLAARENKLNISFTPPTLSTNPSPVVSGNKPPANGNSIFHNITPTLPLPPPPVSRVFFAFVSSLDLLNPYSFILGTNSIAREY